MNPTQATSVTSGQAYPIASSSLPAWSQQGSNGALPSASFPQLENPGTFVTPSLSTASSSPSTSCFSSPGPASPTLYCAQTQDGTWLTWRWYRCEFMTYMYEHDG